MRRLIAALGITLGLFCLAQAQTVPVQQLLLYSGAALDPTTTAWINAVVAAGGTVGATQRTNVDTLIRGLKTDFGSSLSSAFDRIWIHASENSAQATIDIVNDQALSNTGGGGVSWTQWNGYAGNASSTFVNSNYNAATNGISYVLNSATLAQYIINNRTTGDTSITSGAFISSHTIQLVPQIAGTKTLFVINDDAGGSGDTTTGTTRGFHVVSRTASNLTTEYLYRSGPDGGNTSSTDTTVSTSIPSGNLYICARNNGGSADSFNSDTIAVTIYAGGLTSTQANNLSTRINNYMTAIGTNVY